ncbi:MAG: ABC transporter substrate-binding protein, partial [Desulfobacterales bacterium]|nr:ABC transporter substrate-binding protein [Desulfobacterales bacterium]
MKKKVFLLILLVIFVLSVLPVFAASTENVVEIWHYWTAGREAQSISCLMDSFREKYPEVSVKDRTIPGSTAELRQQLGIAFMGGNPPEIFQVGPGYNLKSYVDAGRLSPITDVWNEISGNKIFPEGIAKLTVFNNEAWAVPLNIHTISTVWYNVKVFEKYNLEEPKTWEEFKHVCSVLKENGLEPIAAAGFWSVYALYPFLITTLGPEGYVAIGEGEVNFTSEKRVREAFELFKEMWIDNLMEDWSGYSWAEAAKPFIEGKVAMYFCMGDWIAPLLESEGMEPIKEFDFFPAPGTRNMIIGQIDALPLTKGSDAPDLSPRRTHRQDRPTLSHHNRRRHARQRPLIWCHRVLLRLHQPEEVCLARLGAEVVHLVVQDNSRFRIHHQRAK